MAAVSSSNCVRSADDMCHALQDSQPRKVFGIGLSPSKISAVSGMVDPNRAIRSRQVISAICSDPQYRHLRRSTTPA